MGARSGQPVGSQRPAGGQPATHPLPGRGQAAASRRPAGGQPASDQPAGSQRPAGGQPVTSIAGTITQDNYKTTTRQLQDNSQDNPQDNSSLLAGMCIHENKNISFYYRKYCFALNLEFIWCFELSCGLSCELSCSCLVIVL